MSPRPPQHTPHHHYLSQLLFVSLALLVVFFFLFLKPHFPSLVSLTATLLDGLVTDRTMSAAGD